MSEKEVLLTKDGFYELQERLEYLKTTARREIAEKIKVAREYGDLSENAEYDEARNAQGFIEGEIQELEYKIKNAKIIEDKKQPKGMVGVGSRVRILDLDMNEEMEYTIVGSDEADLDAKRISNESPVGKALVGSRVEDTVTVSAPGGEFKIKILSVK
ncbi:MAG: transcription elongation factor GreA [Eubacteriaceae bacterium]|nr:transcription elongation factor GreA [Eubacteriaceae bacterium]MBR2779979.1 transcription elongation factor GreA [Eubacteriaceae bacterium]MCR4895049.1 transcription elongation factor GreA [Eubacteriales bacterium]